MHGVTKHGMQVNGHTERIERDNCRVCEGTSGGVPGNENIVHGVVICDYCTCATLGADGKTVDDALKRGDIEQVRRLMSQRRKSAAGETE
jgi:hypothetical protein